jgi:3-oxoacyl-[acyl-carrier protein] reductase
LIFRGALLWYRGRARDWRKNGTYVNAIAPGAYETEMTRGFDYSVQTLPVARWGHPSDMAEAILFLASEASNYITGQVLNVDGGGVMA